VTITGTPAAGDTFTVAPSSNQSLFRTLGDLINALESPPPAAGAATSC
jgi:flagellar hook-associated protein 3 FlgL